MPMSSRSSSLSRKTAPIIAGTASASRWTRTRRGLGTTSSVIAMPTSAKATISQKMPGTPTKCATIGPSTSAIMKDPPMVIPTNAIALVRFSSLVRSATSARMTEPTAPPPCSARPTITPPIDDDSRRDGATEPEQDESEDDHDLAADPVGQEAEWNLQKPLRQSVDAQRFPDQVRGRAAERAGIGRKHRVDHEQAKQPDGEDGREGAGGAEFLFFHRLVPAHRLSTAQAPARRC